MKFLFVGACIAPIAFAASAAFAATSASASEAPSGGNPEASATELVEIVVTAQRRAESLQLVPLSVSAVSADQLAANNVRSLEGLATTVPGYQGPGENGQTAPRIRGVGSQYLSPGNEGAVALYIDDVYIGATGPAALALNPLAISQVAVLKGPQGTLFGRNTTGGLVQITTRTPSFDWEAKGEIGYANYDTASVALYVGGPVSEKVANGFSLQALRQGEGWSKNLFNGDDTYRRDLNLSIRNKTLIDLSEDLRAIITADYQRLENTGLDALRPVYGSKNAFGQTSLLTGMQSNSNLTSTSMAEAHGVSGRLDYDAGFATLVSITAYRNTRFNSFGTDLDNSPLKAMDSSRYTKSRQFSQELQLISPSEQRLKWTVGAFYYQAHDETTLDQNMHLPLIIKPAPVGAVVLQRTNGVQDTDSLSLYAQGTYPITDALSVTLGGRYTIEPKDFSGSVIYQNAAGVFTNQPFAPDVQGTLTDRSPTWRAAVDYKFSDRVMGYASYNRGAKSGGFYVQNPHNPPFATEQLDAYEVGLKTRILDDRMRLNIAAFYYDYSDIQVTQYLLGTAIIYNGARAELKGLDVDFEVRPFRGLTLSGGFEVLDAEFTSFPNAVLLVPRPAGGFATTVGSAEGNKLPFTSPFTASLAAMYDIQTEVGDFRLAANIYHNDGFYSEADNRLHHESYDLIGASMEYTLPSRRAYLRLWGANLSNELVANFMLTSTIGTGMKFNAPRTYGATLGFSF